MTAPATLTWLDAFKLFVPIAGSLVVPLFVLWVQVSFSNWRERTSKQDFLWRVIKQDSPNVVAALTALAEIGNEASEGKVKIRAFELPKPATDFARDLSELDPKNSHVYADYVAYTDICRYGFTSLTHFTKEFAILPDSHNSDRLGEVIVQQVNVLKKDLVKLAESELAVAKIISERNSRKIAKIVKKYDTNDIATIKDNLNAAKAKIR